MSQQMLLDQREHPVRRHHITSGLERQGGRVVSPLLQCRATPAPGRHPPECRRCCSEEGAAGTGWREGGDTYAAPEGFGVCLCCRSLRCVTLPSSGCLPWLQQPIAAGGGEPAPAGRSSSCSRLAPGHCTPGLRCGREGAQPCGTGAALRLGQAGQNTSRLSHRAGCSSNHAATEWHLCSHRTRGQGQVSWHLVCST